MNKLAAKVEEIAGSISFLLRVTLICQQLHEKQTSNTICDFHFLNSAEGKGP